MKVFVTGATGFVGYALVRRLLSDGADVKVLVRPTSDATRLMGLNIDVVEGDIRDRSVLQAAVKGCDHVYHVAALYALSGRKEEFFDINVNGTLNVLHAAADAGVERVVYTSTVAAVGAAGAGGLADEETEWNLGDIRLGYVQSKREAEIKALEFAEGRIDLVVVNPSGPIGPYDAKPTPTGRLLLRCLRGSLVWVPNAPMNFVDVESVVQGHLLAMEKGQPGRRYILAGTNTTAKLFLDMASKRTGLRKVWPLPWAVAYLAGFFGQYIVQGLFRRPCDTTLSSISLLRRRFHYSADRAKNELGWEPGDIEEGMVKAVRWYCDNGYVQPKRAKRILAKLDETQGD